MVFEYSWPGSVVSVCKKANGIKQLDNPYGVTFDNKAGKIYVININNN